MKILLTGNVLCDNKNKPTREDVMGALGSIFGHTLFSIIY